jgi:hypothetical protein
MRKILCRDVLYHIPNASKVVGVGNQQADKHLPGLVKAKLGGDATIDRFRQYVFPILVRPVDLADRQ